MERIEEGTYGLCRKCGSEIEHERLEFIPESTFCTKCIRAMSG
ncbi:MAG: TraR/DksA C4-type zinc finger protein [Chitinispirillaceae bacterium]